MGYRFLKALLTGETVPFIGIIHQQLCFSEEAAELSGTELFILSGNCQ